jgi:arylsulfatase A-like enzyme
MKTPPKTSRVPVSPAQIALLALWVALLTSLAELSILAALKFGFHRYPRLLTVYSGWMTPLSYLLLFALPAGLLAMVAWRWPRWLSLRLAGFVLTALGAFSLLLLWYSLSHYASLLLAIGVAAETSRQMAKRSQGFVRFLRLSVGWLAALTLLVALVPVAWRQVDEQRALAALPPARPQAPNVVLLTLDTVRAHNLSLYGYARSTSPHLEQLARDGTCFDRAFATASWTLPSHASMFTGKYPHELSADWLTPMSATDPALAEVLAAQGYDCGGFVANYLYSVREFGLNRGFAHYEDYPLSAGQMVLSSEVGRTVLNHWRARKALDQAGLLNRYELLNRKSAAVVNRDFLHWLDHIPNRPFFAFLNYMDAHDPYLPPGPFDGKFGPKRPPGSSYAGPGPPFLSENMFNWGWQVTPAEGRIEQDAYDAAIAYLDEQVGVLLGELRRRGLRENTLLIITADHGEQFGEHGLYCHGNSLYLPVLHVPLVISFPGHVPAGRRIREAVSLRDLAATVTDLLALSGSSPFPGQSLARHWNERGAALPPGGDWLFAEIDTRQEGTCSCEGRGPSPLVAEVRPFPLALPRGCPRLKGPMHSLMGDGKHYLRNAEGREELYDYETDLLEEHDLAALEEHRETLERMRACLDALLSGSRQQPK